MVTVLHQATSATVGDGGVDTPTASMQPPPPAYEEYHRIQSPHHCSSSLQPPAYDDVANKNNGDNNHWTPSPHRAVFVTMTSQHFTPAEMYSHTFDEQPPSYNSITSQQRAGSGAAGISTTSAGFNTLRVPATRSSVLPYSPASRQTATSHLRSASVDTTSMSMLNSVSVATQRRASDSQSVSIVGPAVLLDARRLASEPNPADDDDQSELSSERESRRRHRYLSRNNQITALSRRINDNYGSSIPDEKISCWMVIRYVLKFFIVVFGLPGPGLVLVIAFGFLADAASVTTQTRRAWIYWTIAIFLGLAAIGVNIVFWAFLIQNQII